jgi:hypothetical protein
MNLKRPTEGLREYRECRFLCRFLDAGNNEGLGTDRTIAAAAGRSACWGEADAPDKGRIAVVDPLLTSLAAAFKTAFERLSGSNVFGLMPDPSFSLSPDYRCRRLLAVLMTR